MSSDVDGVAPPQPPASRRISGVPFVVGAALIFSLHGCAVRLSSEAGFSTLQLSFVVGFVRLLIGTVILPFKRQWWASIFCTGHGSGFVALVVLRNIVGCIALACIFGSFARLPLGEATSLVFTSPIWVTILARIFLGEPITRFNTAGAVLACGGVALIASGGVAEAELAAGSGSLDLDVPTERLPAQGYSERSVGMALALLGALTLSMVMVTTRKIGERMPAVVSIMYYGIVVLAASVAISACVREPLMPSGISARMWLMVVGSAALSFMGQVFNTMALQRLEAGPVQVLGTLEIVFSFFWQALFLRMPLSPRSALGALTIISCAALIATQKLLANRAAAAATRLRPYAELEAAEVADGDGEGEGEERQGVAMPHGRRSLVPFQKRHAPLAVGPAPDSALAEADGAQQSWASDAHVERQK